MAKGNGRTRKQKRQTAAVERPILDEETRRRREVLAEMKQMSDDELFKLTIRAGIYTKDGKLTAPYRDDADPSDCRPTD